MFRAFYRRIKSFLAWVNGESAGGPSKEAVEHRRDIENRWGGGDFGGGNGGG
jgi:hypothetical protein